MRCVLVAHERRGSPDRDTGRHLTHDTGRLTRSVRSERLSMSETQPDRVPHAAPDAQGIVPLVSMQGISITFPGVKALDDVDFRLLPGEVHALLGENGAGKSTLIKALTGVYSIDSGTITVDGEELRFAGPSQAQAAGISTVYQEVNLCENLSVAENVMLGPRGPARRARQLAGHPPRRPRAPARDEPRHRPVLIPLRALPRGPAAGRDLPGDGDRRPGPRPRRAHLQPGRRRGRPAVRRPACAAQTRAWRSCSSRTSSTRSTRSATG